jgi:hypothetical protein
MYDPANAPKLRAAAVLARPDVCRPDNVVRRAYSQSDGPRCGTEAAGAGALRRAQGTGTRQFSELIAMRFVPLGRRLAFSSR